MSSIEIPSVTPPETGNFVSRAIRGTMESKAGQATMAVVATAGLLAGCNSNTPSVESTPTLSPLPGEQWFRPNANNPDFVSRLTPGMDFEAVPNFSLAAKIGESACGNRPCTAASFLTVRPPKGGFVNLDLDGIYPVEPDPTKGKPGDKTRILCQIPDGDHKRGVDYVGSPVWDVFSTDVKNLDPAKIAHIPPENFDIGPDGERRLNVVTYDVFMNNSGYRGKEIDCVQNPEMGQRYKLGHLTLSMDPEVQERLQQQVRDQVQQPQPTR